MVQQLVEALDDLYLEKRVRAIILTGAGDSFCVGADVAEMRASKELDDPEEQWGADAADFRDLLVRMLEITKPIIAAVHGPALAAAPRSSPRPTSSSPATRRRSACPTRGTAWSRDSRRRC